MITNRTYCLLSVSITASKFATSTKIGKGIFCNPAVSSIGTPEQGSMIILFSHSYYVVKAYSVDTVQDFLIKLGIKPRLHILKISIFSLNHVIVRPTKIMNNLLKVCKICTFKVIFGIINQPNLSKFFFSVKNIWLGDQLL